MSPEINSELNPTAVTLARVLLMITTIGAAVSAGLAVAALGRRVAPSWAVDVGPKFGLPRLPARDVVLYSNLTDRQASVLS